MYDDDAPALYRAFFPALAGVFVVSVAYAAWWLLSPSSVAVTVAIVIVTGIVDAIVVHRVTRASIARGLMPPAVSPLRCTLFVIAAGASVLLWPYLPTKYDSRSRSVSGPHVVVAGLAHLAMGWLGTRRTIERDAAGTR